MMRILIAALCLTAPVFGQRATAVFLYTPNARPLAGMPVQVDVMAIDANSNLLGNANAVWTTNNAAVAEFRGGQIVTKSPGMVDLSVTVLGARGVLRQRGKRQRGEQHCGEKFPAHRRTPGIGPPPARG